jgi:hypothetical protein
MPAIFNHHIEEMAAVVLDALETQSNAPLRERIEASLASYWTDLGAITWSVNDVMGEYPALSLDQARVVLADVVHGHDASLGFCWDDMGEYVHQVVPDYSAATESAVILTRLRRYAARLVAAGDMEAFASVFDSDDPAYDVATMDGDARRGLYHGLVFDGVKLDDE